MGQNRNNNYRCDDEHLNKIAQLSSLKDITKSEVMRQIVDLVYEDPGLLEEDPLTSPDVTWEELGRGFIEQEPDYSEGGE